VARPTPNFVILDGSLPDVGRLVAAMLKARQAVESRSWSHSQGPTTEEWWADVLADPRAQIRKRRSSEQVIDRTFYRLADEPRETILVACSKCEWNRTAWGAVLSISIPKSEAGVIRYFQERTPYTESLKT
jgi:hypothetical protein